MHYILPFSLSKVSSCWLSMPQYLCKPGHIVTLPSAVQRNCSSHERTQNLNLLHSHAKSLNSYNKINIFPLWKHEKWVLWKHLIFGLDVTFLLIYFLSFSLLGPLWKHSFLLSNRLLWPLWLSFQLSLSRHWTPRLLLLSAAALQRGREVTLASQQQSVETTQKKQPLCWWKI